MACRCMSDARLNVLLHVAQLWRRGGRISEVGFWGGRVEEEEDVVGSETGELRMVEAASIGANDSSAGALRDRLGDPWYILKVLPPFL